MMCPLVEYMEYKRWRRTYPGIASMTQEATYEVFIKTRMVWGLWRLTDEEEQEIENRKTEARNIMLANQSQDP